MNTKRNLLGLVMLALFAMFASIGVAADYATVTAAVAALDGAAATTTTSYLSWVTLGVGAILVGVAVWAIRKGLSLRK